MLLISQGKIPTIGDRFSPAIRDFLSCCINHDVERVNHFSCFKKKKERDVDVCGKQRSSARQLLQHVFITTAGKTRLLTELIDRLEAWRSDNRDDSLRNSIAARFLFSL